MKMKTKMTLKKVLCVILAVATAVVGIPFSAIAASKETVNFGILSDTHYFAESSMGETAEDKQEFVDMMLLNNSTTGLAPELLDAALANLALKAKNGEIEFVLMPGDLTRNAEYAGHVEQAEKLAKFEAETGKPVYVVPGNHDYGVDCETNLDDFTRVYADFGYNEALSTLEGTASYTVDLNEKYRLIALDSNDPTKSTEDGMSLEKIEWVHAETKKAKEDGKYPILMMHHNLLDHLPVQRILSRNFIVRFHYTTATLFADWGIKLVFTGHEHCSDATSYTTPSGNVIYDFATTALTMYPLQYRYFTVTDSEIKYEAKTVDSIDTDALVAQTAGYEQEHIDLMNAGLNLTHKPNKDGSSYRIYFRIKN